MIGQGGGFAGKSESSRDVYLSVTGMATLAMNVLVSRKGYYVQACTDKVKYQSIFAVIASFICLVRSFLCSFLKSLQYLSKTVPAK